MEVPPHFGYSGYGHPTHHFLPHLSLHPPAGPAPPSLAATQPPPQQSGQPGMHPHAAPQHTAGQHPLQPPALVQQAAALSTLHHGGYMSNPSDGLLERPGHPGTLQHAATHPGVTPLTLSLPALARHVAPGHPPQPHAPAPHGQHPGQQSPAAYFSHLQPAQQGGGQLLPVPGHRPHSAAFPSAAGREPLTGGDAAARPPPQRHAALASSSLDQRDTNAPPPPQSPSPSEREVSAISARRLLRGSYPQRGQALRANANDEYEEATPDAEVFTVAMEALLNDYGPTWSGKDGVKMKEAAARACWIRDFIVWQTQIVADDFGLSLSTCRKMFMSGSGIVDIRQPSEVNQWREWRSATKKDPLNTGTQTHREWTRHVYERWNYFKTDPLRSDAENAAAARAKAEDFAEIAKWQATRAHDARGAVDATPASSALEQVNRKLAEVAISANDIHAISVITIAAHPNKRTLAVTTGTPHAKRVFDQALKKVHPGTHSLSTIAEAFFLVNALEPSPEHLPPGTILPSHEGSLDALTLEDIHSSASQNWAVVHSMLNSAIQDMLERAADPIVFEDAMTVWTNLTNFGLMVVGWPGYARSLLPKATGSIEHEVQHDESDSSAATSTSPTQLTPDPGQPLVVMPDDLDKAAPDTGYSYTIRAGSLAFARDWSRPQARKMLWAMKRTRSLITIVTATTSTGDIAAPGPLPPPQQGEAARNERRNNATISGLASGEAARSDGAESDPDEGSEGERRQDGSGDDEGEDAPPLRSVDSINKALRKRRRESARRAARTSAPSSDNFSESETENDTQTRKRQAQTRPASAGTARRRDVGQLGWVARLHAAEREQRRTEDAQELTAEQEQEESRARARAVRQRQDYDSS
ncbi:hypothetical protein V8E36_003238 [Tilletia maclaganii]